MKIYIIKDNLCLLAKDDGTTFVENTKAIAK